MSGIIPAWSKATGDAFVLKFEERLWNFLIPRRYYTVRFTSRVWGDYSTTLKDSFSGRDVAAKTVQYVVKRFGWNPSDKVTDRRTIVTGGGFGGLDNR